MKHYNQPETQVLQVINNSILCASEGPVPGPARVNVQTMSVTNETAW